MSAVDSGQPSAMEAGVFRYKKTVSDEAATARIAAALARQCAVGDCILLHGDLGAGKTSFARGFIRSLCGPQEEVTSPTFTLLQTYPTAQGFQLWHFDLYRLQNPEEIHEIGIEDALQFGISLIEWPEIIENALPADVLHITIGLGESATQRHLTFSGLERVWQDRLNAL